MKPGYKTTEFWLTLLMQVIAVLATLGYIRPEHRAGVEAAVSDAATAATALLMAGVTLWRYTQSRQDLKQWTDERSQERFYPAKD